MKLKAHLYKVLVIKLQTILIQPGHFAPDIKADLLIHGLAFNLRREVS